MKRVIKGVIGIFSIVFFTSIFSTITSCNESEEYNLTPQSNSFLQFYSKNYESTVTQNIVDTPITSRSSSIIQKSESITLYADFPQNTNIEIRQLCTDIKTPNDIAALQHATAVDFSYKKTPTSDSIVLNKEKVEQTIAPMIQKSKEYLLEKGFSQKEIQEMLIENNSNESQLVTLVMILTDAEFQQTQTAKKNQKDPLYYLATPTYAKSDQYVLTKDLFNCGIEAIGADILVGLGQSTAKKWSKTIIKEVFKTVAKKAIGPIGVAISIVEFGLCLSRKGYTCVYAVSSPISKKVDALTARKNTYSNL